MGFEDILKDILTKYGPFAALFVLMMWSVVRWQRSVYTAWIEQLKADRDRQIARLEQEKDFYRQQLLGARPAPPTPLPAAPARGKVSERRKRELAAPAEGEAEGDDVPDAPR